MGKQHAILLYYTVIILHTRRLNKDYFEDKGYEHGIKVWQSWSGTISNRNGRMFFSFQESQMANKDDQASEKWSVMDASWSQTASELRKYSVSGNGKTWNTNRWF